MYILSFNNVSLFHIGDRFNDAVTMYVLVPLETLKSIRRKSTELKMVII